MRRRAATILLLLFLINFSLLNGCKTTAGKGENNLEKMKTIINGIADGEYKSETPFITGMGEDFNKNLNKMWQIYGSVSDGTNAIIKIGDVPTWFEWIGKKIMWTGDTGYKKDLKRPIRDCPMSEDGYMWSWTDDEEWPTGSKYLHFDGIPKFILGVYRVVMWEGAHFLFRKDITTINERDFSKGLTVLEKIRKAMDYQLRELNGINGMMIINNGRNTGLSNGEPSNYWDYLLFGFKDGYSNIYFYASIMAMKEIEQLVKDDPRAVKYKESKYLELYEDPSLPMVIKTTRDDSVKETKTVFKKIEKTAEFYTELSKKAKKAYNDNFWNEVTRRYAGWIDINGKMHDFGFIYVNTEAIAYGLASNEQAASIYEWLDGTRIVNIDTSKGSDVYFYKVAPRVNTVPITKDQTDECNGLIPLETSGGWDENQQNGGTIFYISHFDILGRILYYSRGSALDRFKVIMDEFKTDELRRDPPNAYGATWKIGIIGEYPESGLVPYTFVEGFAGITADIDGISINPNVPEEMKYCVVRGVSYKNAFYNIGVDSDGSVIINKERGKAEKVSFKIKGFIPDRNYTVEQKNLKTNESSSEKVKADKDGVIKLFYENLDNGVVVTIKNK